VLCLEPSWMDAPAAPHLRSRECAVTDGGRVITLCEGRASHCEISTDPSYSSASISARVGRDTLGSTKVSAPQTRLTRSGDSRCSRAEAGPRATFLSLSIAFPCSYAPRTGSALRLLRRPPQATHSRNCGTLG